MSPCKVRTALGGSHRGMRIDSEVPVGGFESHVGAGGVEGVEVDVDVLACPDGPVTAQDSTCTLRTFGHAPSPFGRVTRDGRCGGRVGPTAARARATAAWWPEPAALPLLLHHPTTSSIPPSIPPTLRASLSDQYDLPPSLPQIRALTPLRPVLRPSIDPSHPLSLLFSLPPSLRSEL